MKKTIIILIYLAVLSLCTSCSEDRLEIPQKGVIAMESFYQTEEDAASAIINVYQTGAFCVNLGGAWEAFVLGPVYFTFSNWPSDDISYDSEINEYRQNFTADNTVVTSMYMGFYRLIYACNLVTDHFEYGMTSNIDRYLSEARVFRAWAHMNLAMYWGTPPLVDHVLTGADRPGNTPHDELMEWCINELRESAPYLPSKSGLDDSANAIRLTKEAALAFLGKAQVFNKDFAGAKETLAQVINSGKYALMPGEEIADLFHRAGDGCREKVFEFNFVDNPGANIGLAGLYHFFKNTSYFIRTSEFASRPTTFVYGEGWGGVTPTGKFARAFMANDGDSFRRKAWMLTYDEFLYELPYASDVAEDGHELSLEEKKTDTSRGIFPTSLGLYGSEGYFPYKILARNTDLIANDSNNCDDNTIIMRYAEVLLLYAEACAMVGDTDGTGLKALNDIQNRAGSAHVSTSLTMDEVKSEKRFEMWLEGMRFIDLVRWGDAEKELKDNGKAVPRFRDLIGTEGHSEHTGYVDWSNAYFNGDHYGFKAGKHELMPFPKSETDVNPNILQNPGW